MNVAVQVMLEEYHPRHVVSTEISKTRPQENRQEPCSAEERWHRSSASLLAAGAPAATPKRKKAPCSSSTLCLNLT